MILTIVSVFNVKIENELVIKNKLKLSLHKDEPYM